MQKSTWDDGGPRTRWTLRLGASTIIHKDPAEGGAVVTHTALSDAVALVRTVDGSGTSQRVELTLRDHLGSPVAVLDASRGQNYGNRSFDPFGLRRSSSWLEDITQVELDDVLVDGATRPEDGLTGHTMLDRVGIVHMGGRLYDPRLGRFLQVDPIVSVPTFTQDWNRYAGMWNNPVGVVDPTGLYEVGDPAPFHNDSWNYDNGFGGGWEKDPEVIVVTGKRLREEPWDLKGLSLSISTSRMESALRRHIVDTAGAMFDNNTLTYLSQMSSACGSGGRTYSSANSRVASVVKKYAAYVIRALGGLQLGATHSRFGRTFIRVTNRWLHALGIHTLILRDDRFYENIRPLHGAGTGVKGKGEFLATILTANTPKAFFAEQIGVLLSKGVPHLAGYRKHFNLTVDFGFSVGISSDERTPTSRMILGLVPGGGGQWGIVTAYPADLFPGAPPAGG